ncbi:MAG: DUF835 domain-containing protein [Candidatus Methanofastidiosia archaeon]|jgi:hypothetical protein
MEVYGTTAVLAALVNLGIGIWVYTKSARSKIGRRFLLIAIVLAAWGVLEGVALFSNQILWARLSYIPFFVIPSGLYHLAHHISEGKWTLAFYASRVVGVLLIMSIFWPSFLQLSETMFIAGAPFLYSMLLHMGMATGGFLLVYTERIKIKGLGKIHRMDVMLYGFMISVSFAYVFMFVSPLLGWGLPRIGSVFAMFSTAAFKYSYVESTPIIYPKVQRTVTTQDALCGARCSLCTSFLKERCKSCSLAEPSIRESCPLYICARKKGTTCLHCDQVLTCQIYAKNRELCPVSDFSKQLPSGTSYRVDSSTYVTARSILRDRIICGDFGLLITREHPTMFFKKWGLEKIPLVWLSDAEETKWTVTPTNLAKLSHMLNSFIWKYPQSCILSEGFEYLIAYNSFDTIMKFVYSLNDAVVRHKCRFILSYDGRTLEREKLALIEKELNILPSQYIIDEYNFSTD